MELPHIGEACTICNRNDYLPFKCAYCAKIVCVDHKVDHGSDCPLTKTSFNAETHVYFTESIRKACDFCRKITIRDELSECVQCHGYHCLYHRLQVQHRCTKLAEEAEARRLATEARVQRLKEAMIKLRSNQSQVATKEKPSQVNPPTRQSDPKKIALARKVNIMRIKGTARGPPNVLDKDKIFFEVEFIHNPSSRLSNETKNGKKLNIFASKAHTIGRLVDYTAHELDVTNKNHDANSDQLVLEIQSQDSSTGMILDSQEPFQKYLDLDILDSGDKLTMTYHSPDESR